MNMIKLGIAIGVGVVDEALEYFDSTAATPRTGHFKTWRDYARIGMPLGGLALAMWKPGRFGAIGETVATASTPLLVKSIIKMARNTAYTQQVAGPRVQQRIPAGNRVGTLMHQQEFKTTRVL